MITSWDIYWITRLDSLIGATIVLLSFFIVLSLGLLCFCIYNYMQSRDTYYNKEEVRKEYHSCFLFFKKYLIISFSSLLFFVFAITLIPTTKEAIAIWSVPKIVNNETVQQIPENFAKLVNDKLQDWMKDTGIDTKKGETNAN